MELKHLYSDSIHHKRVAVLGIYPPPYGGVSIHIQRVIDKLKKQHNHVYFFNTEPRYRYKLPFLYCAKLLVWLLWVRPDIIFFHSAYLDNSLYDLCIIGGLKKFLRYTFVLIEHNSRHVYTRNNMFRAQRNRYSSNIDQVVFIGNTTLKSYQDNNIVYSTYSIEGAFLPPDALRASSILTTYPKNIFTFIADRSPCLLINGSQIMMHDNKDVYGFDLVIDLIKDVKNCYPNVGLVLALARIGNQSYFQKLIKQINIARLEKHIHFFIGQRPLWPLFPYVDLFVRPSRYDSYGISIAEALHFGIPAVASDVCVRPVGTITFPSGAQDKFFQEVTNVLKG